MLSPSDFIAQVSLRGMLHCKPEIVGVHPCSGDYTLIHHCNLNNDFIQQRKIKIEDRWGSGSGIGVGAEIGIEKKVGLKNFPLQALVQLAFFCIKSLLRLQ